MHGGHIVAQGTPSDIMNNPKSLTGKYLTGELSVAIPERRPPNHRRTIKVVNARGNNLKNVSAEIPLGLFTCVTGVSGGGKSTLLIDTLYKAIAPKLNNASEGAASHDRIEGLEHIDKIIDIDQSPIGRTPRSNPATYTGAFTPIRELFAGLPEAKARGYKPGRFSFNVKGGRCEACQGDGVIKIEMHFLPDVYVECDVCKGKRYNRETLEMLFKDKNIADVLDMTVEEAAEFFKKIPAIRETLRPCTASGSATSISANRPPPCPAAKPSASNWQPNCQSAPPGARSTSWTSRPPACISTMSRSFWRCCTNWCAGQYGGGHRA